MEKRSRTGREKQKRLSAGPEQKREGPTNRTDTGLAGKNKTSSTPESLSPGLGSRGRPGPQTHVAAPGSKLWDGASLFFLPRAASSQAVNVLVGGKKILPEHRDLFPLAGLRSRSCVPLQTSALLA